jgi:hypothetical protein
MVSRLCIGAGGKVLLLLAQRWEGIGRAYHVGHRCSAAVLFFCLATGNSRQVILLVTQKLVFSRGQSEVDSHLRAPAQHLQGIVLLPLREQV